jgi:hypothetical protein
MALYDIVKETEVLIGGKGDNPSGTFKKWLESPEGQKALSHGMEIEKEHTKNTKIAREIATDHLKEDRQYYQKLAKAGLDEGIYDDPKQAAHDIVDDIPDQGEPPPKPSLFLALHAVENPNKAKATAGKSKQHQRNMMLSLRELVSHASALFKDIQGITVAESSMGVSGPAIANPEIEPGSGVPIKKPIVKRKMNAKVMRLGTPAQSSMIGQNPMIPGRSAFAKGIE